MRALLAVVLLLGVSLAPARAACPPEGKTREQLEALKVLKWTVPDAAERQVLAEGLVDCLADADPTLRDGIAYEALSHWMRAGEIDELGLRSLRDRLYAGLQARRSRRIPSPVRCTGVVGSRAHRSHQAVDDAGGTRRDGRYRIALSRIGDRLPRLRRQGRLAAWRGARQRLADAARAESGARSRAARSHARGHRDAGRAVLAARVRVRRTGAPRASGDVHREARIAHARRMGSVARRACAEARATRRLTTTTDGCCVATICWRSSRRCISKPIAARIRNCRRSKHRSSRD